MHKHAVLHEQRVEVGHSVGLGYLVVIFFNHLRMRLGGGSQRHHGHALGQIALQRRGGVECIVDHHCEQRGYVGDAAVKHSRSIGAEMQTLHVHAIVGRKHVVDRQHGVSLITFLGQALGLQALKGCVAVRIQRSGCVIAQRGAMLAIKIDILCECIHGSQSFCSLIQS